MLQESEFSILRKGTGLSLQEVATKSGYDLRTVYRWENGEYSPKKALLEWLQSQQLANGKTKSQTTDFTFIDLFAGIGGIRKAFESVGGKCTFTSEWDLACQKTYQANFGYEPIYVRF